MYTLTLKNFKCFVIEKTVTFHNLGFILLSAPSGSGKSTLLNGLFYAITGSLKGLSKKKVYVSFSLKSDNPNTDFTIVRNDTKTTLKIGKGEWTGTEAQTRIDTLFPHFVSVSYIDQLNLYNFTSLSPADKNEFLRDLLLKEFNIEQLEESVKKNIKDQKEDISRDTIRIELLQKMISTPIKPEGYVVGSEIVSTNNIDSLLKMCHENVGLFEKNIKQAKERHRMWKEDQHILDQLSVLHKERDSFQSYDFGSISELQTTIQKYNSLKDQLHLQQLEKTLQEKVLIQTEEISLLKKELDGKPDVSLLKRAQMLNHTLTELTPEITSGGVSHKMDDLNKKLIELNEHIELQTVLICPSCDSHLTLEGTPEHKKLVKRTSSCLITPRDLNELQTEKKELEKKLEKLKSKQSKYEMSLTKYNETKLELEKINLGDIDVGTEIEKNNDLTNRIKVLEQDSYIHDLKQKIKKLNLNRIVLSPSDESFCCTLVLSEGIEAEYNEKSIQLGMLLKAKPRYENVLSKINDLESKPLRVPTYQQEIEEENMLEWEKKREESKQHIHHLQEWERVQTEYEKCMIQRNELAELISKKNVKMNTYQSHLTFKDLVKKAETVCLEEFVQSLNEHASLYLDEVFDDPIIVELKTSTEQKNGNVKQVLNFQINYKDMVCSISDLSGGEHDRVHLCYTLALSEMLNNRILLLDECFGTLDEKNNTKVVEMLQEKNITRTSLILCVAHRAVEGAFDQIITL